MGMPSTVIAAMAMLAGTLALAAGPRPPEDQADGPFSDIKVAPVAAT